MNLTRGREDEPFVERCGRMDAAGPRSFCQHCSVRTRAFCSVLNDSALAQLELMHSMRDLAPEENLFMEGDSANAFYTVLSGSLRLSKLLPDGRRQITGFVLPGEFVGLAVGTTYDHNAEALDKASLCRFSKNDLHRIGRENPEMEGRLLEMTNANLSMAQEHMLLLGRMNAQ